MFFYPVTAIYDEKTHFENKGVKEVWVRESLLYQKYGLISESCSLLVSNAAPHFFELKSMPLSE